MTTRQTDISWWIDGVAAMPERDYHDCRSDPIYRKHGLKPPCEVDPYHPRWLPQK